GSTWRRSRTSSTLPSVDATSTTRMRQWSAASASRQRSRQTRVLCDTTTAVAANGEASTLSAASNRRTATFTAASALVRRARNRLHRAGVGSTELEERLDELAFLEVIAFGVDAPDVMSGPVDDVERGEDCRPHRVILVVVPVQAVATACLEILEPLEIIPDRRDRVLVLGVVHRICLRHEHLDPVDDFARIEQADPRQLRR